MCTWLTRIALQPANGIKYLSSMGKICDPYVTRLGSGAFYNPLSGETMGPQDFGFAEIEAAWMSRGEMAEKEGWTVDAEADSMDLARRYVMRYLSLEAMTRCNQACYFCPVSLGQREVAVMAMESFEVLVKEVADLASDSLHGVFLFNYNEPTLDKRLIDRLRVLRAHSLPIALNTNGTGFTPKLTDAIRELGGIERLSVNLSTVDPERYKAERGHNHLPQVLRNLDYLALHPVANHMEITVLSADPEVLAGDVLAIGERFAGTPFQIMNYLTMNRAGNAPDGGKDIEAIETLKGCDNLGSRVVEHVHIDPSGHVFLCCQDYHAEVKLGSWEPGNLTNILTSDRAAQVRQWVHGMAPAPANFLCRKCEFAC